MPAAHPEKERFQSWIETIRMKCGSRFYARTSLKGWLFIGDISSHGLPGLEISRVRTNVQQLARPSPWKNQDGDQHCFLIMQRSGRTRVRQFDHTLELNPGDIALIDSAGASELLPLGLVEHDAMHLSRDILYSHLPHSRQAYGKLPQNGVCGHFLKLIYTQLSTLQNIDNNEAKEQESQAMHEAIIKLLTPVMCDERAATTHILNELPNDKLLHYAQQFIHNNIFDPSLNSERVAKQLGMSLRQLYRIFEGTDDSIYSYIQRTRLERCARDLRDATLHHLSIAEIAQRWGFTSASNFSRAFRHQFSCTPRSYRI
ncbi:transcriptional regulator FeaR [Pseudomonas sp. LTJR-52]|uniref:transcriptional regulator FeaR n=1 Tax=Pseudomonas sp. LTJR-52 TaxID=2479392 RepID=UPI000EFB38E9|nr:transcriptional regulator FeaR [Pseudomonas sp. LTJR-52]AYN96976.1 transcriptional regulator FeaR [Pseudomonas sp. LTJR-52]